MIDYAIQFQLKPKIEWGLVCLNLTPMKVEEEKASVYCSFLSALKANWNITEEFRDLPEMYQGCGCLISMQVDQGHRYSF